MLCNTDSDVSDPAQVAASSSDAGSESPQKKKQRTVLSKNSNYSNNINSNNNDSFDVAERLFSVHRFLILDAGTIGLNLMLLQSSKKCIISTVHANSIAVNHGIEEGDEIIAFEEGDEMPPSHGSNDIYYRFNKTSSNRPLMFDVKRVYKQPGKLIALSSGAPVPHSLHQFIITTSGPLGVKFEKRDSMILLKDIAAKSVASIHGLQNDDILCIPDTKGELQQSLAEKGDSILPMTIEVWRAVSPTSASANNVLNGIISKAMTTTEVDNTNKDNTENKAANRDTNIDYNYTVVDGVQYTDEELKECVRILSNKNAWLDDNCVQIQMMRLQKNIKENQNDSLEIICVNPSIMTYLTTHDNKDQQNTEQEEEVIKELKLPNEDSDKLKGTPPKRKMLIIPISDAFPPVPVQQLAKARIHWSLLICDIQASADKGVKVQFRHFDSNADSKNLESAELVAGSLYMMIFKTTPKTVMIEECEAPQQNNDCNCGLYVLIFAEALSKDNNTCIANEGGNGDINATNLRCEMLRFLQSTIEEEELSYDASKIPISAHIIPCLSLHALHGGDEVINRFPNILSCNLNTRKLESVRLGVNCSDRTKNNILHSLRSGEVIAQAVIQGSVIIVFSSFKMINNNNYNNEPFVMKSVTQCDEDEEPIYQAIPLTEESVSKALSWMQGVDAWTLAEESDEEKLKFEESIKFDSIEDGLKMYWNQLNEMIPLQLKSTETRKPSDIISDAYSFINDHLWDDNGVPSAELTSLCNDIHDGSAYVTNDMDDECMSVKKFDYYPDLYEEMCYKIRHFLHRNVAHQTRVVAHIVDGIHRLTGLECVLNGYGKEDENENCSTYHNQLPHSKMKVNTIVILLTDSHVDRGKAFTAGMKNLSSRTQQNFGCTQKLDKKVFFGRMIELLHKNNTVLGIDNIDTIMDHIINIICSNEAAAYYSLVPGLFLDGINKSTAQIWKEHVNNQCVFGTTIRYTAMNIIKKFGTLNHERRYQLPPQSINAELFELILILIWSCLSKDTYTQLLKFFVNDSTMQQISTSTDELVNVWLTSMIINVFSFVYYSSKATWKAMTHTNKEKKKKITDNCKLSVCKGQLLKAIESSTQHFSIWGSNPEHPSWFNRVSSKQLANRTYLLQQYKIIFEEKGLCELDESVAKKKDHIEGMLLTGTWVKLLDFYSVITVAYSQYLKNITDEIMIKNVNSLVDYCKLKIEQEFNTDQFVSNITRIFLENFVPKPISYVGEALHPTPTPIIYGAIEKVVEQFTDLGFNDYLKQMRSTATGHLEKAQIDRLIVLRRKVDIELFSKTYATEMNRNQKKK